MHQVMIQDVQSSCQLLEEPYTKEQLLLQRMHQVLIQDVMSIPTVCIKSLHANY